MKLVTAVVKPFVLGTVKDALKSMGIRGLTVTEVSGYGRQGGHKEVYRGETITVDFILKVKLEILCEDEEADSILSIIANSARTGQIGDGKVWVTDVDTVVRVRTGEAGVAAI